MAQLNDPRNIEVLNYVAGRFVGQYEAAVPLFDAGFLHGKLVWSSPRLIGGRIFRLADHLEKIRRSAELNHFPVIPTSEDFITAIRETLLKNNMTDGVHVRVVLTAGDQVTASMDLAAVVNWDGTPSAPRIIIMPEYRDNVYDAKNGISLMTSTFKRPGPDTVDQVSHDNNQNASSRALAEAKRAGNTSSLMYDPEGFLAEAPASHVAIIKDGALRTPFVRCCPPGVTRKVILEICAANGIAAEEADITPDEIRAADEMFLMGTMSGPVAAISLDGKPVGSGEVGPVTLRLCDLYSQALVDPAHGFDLDLSD